MGEGYPSMISSSHFPSPVCINFGGTSELSPNRLNSPRARKRGTRRATVQSEEPLEDTVHGIVEGNGVETVDRSRSKEILVIVGGEVRRLGKT
jgi:hypothetical protein